MIPLSEIQIRRSLPPELRDLSIHLFAEIDSTNNEAKRQMEAGCTLPALFLAEGQTAGRGRQGKSFFSPADSGLYMSLALEKPENAADAVSLTTRAAVAVCRAIRALTGLAPGIKWVNDLYLNDKKICGILAEAREQGVVIGIGVNIGKAAFPEELEGIAASLQLPELDRNVLAARITEELFRPGDYMEDYRAWSIVLGKPVTYWENGAEKSGIAREIDDLGGLLVETESGMEVLRSGEISLRIK